MVKKKVNETLTAKQIEKALFLEYRDERGLKYFSSNSYALGHECDFVAISQAEFAIEFEIKRSKSDFLCEFKNKKGKHDKVKKGLLANYFYFVCEEGVLDIKDIPEYCGFINISKGKTLKRPYLFHMIKTAPRLHDRKVSKDMILKLQTTIINKYYQNLE